MSTLEIELVQLKQSDVPGLRERLLEEQAGVCPICSRQVDSPCLDHSHVKRLKGTGQVRGVVCRTCNVLLAKAENNCVRYGVDQKQLPEVLRNMASYLERPHLNYIHPSEAIKAPKLKKSSYNKLKKEWKGRRKVPEYPRSGKLSKDMRKMFEQTEIEPEFYK